MGCYCNDSPDERSFSAMMSPLDHIIHSLLLQHPHILGTCTECQSKHSRFLELDHIEFHTNNFAIMDGQHW